MFLLLGPLQLLLGPVLYKGHMHQFLVVSEIRKRQKVPLKQLLKLLFKGQHIVLLEKARSMYCSSKHLSNIFLM